jgi:hypothetical protein
VANCTRTKQTDWTEDQFTVTASTGIQNLEKRVADIVVRELKRTNPVSRGCVQVHEVWSTEEEVHIRSGHFWISKFGTVPGSMSYVEKKFELTFQEWDLSTGTDDASTPVEMFVNSSNLRATDFHLAEVSPLQLDVVSCGDRRTRGATVRKHFFKLFEKKN